MGRGRAALRPRGRTARVNPSAPRRGVLASTPLGAPGSFVEAWWEGNPVATQWIPAAPATPSAWRTVVSSSPARSLPGPIVDTLCERQRAMGAGARAESSARALAQATTRVVVTGQQPSPYGGALLVLHKAATAIALAAHMEAQQSEGRIVPCFWLADDDHDVDEAASVTLHNRQGQPQRVRLAFARDRRSLRHHEFSPDMAQGIHDEVSSLLPDTTRAGEVLASLAPLQGESYSAWVGRCVTSYLGDRGLVLLEPMWLESDIAARAPWMVRHASAIAEAIQESGDAFAQAGLLRPLATDQHTVPFFLRQEPQGPRVRPSQQTTGEWQLPDPNQLAKESWRVSVDVVGRVLMQNALLPVAAHVVGPTEMAYVAQIAAAASRVGTHQPLVWPRAHATWIDAKTAMRMKQVALTPRDVLQSSASPLPQPHAGSSEASAQGELEGALDAQWLAFLRGVSTELASAHGSAIDAAWRGKQRELHARWKRVKEALLRARDRDGEARGRGRQRVIDALMPRGRPQERVLCPLSLAARYGLTTVARGAALLDPLERDHQVLTFD